MMDKATLLKPRHDTGSGMREATVPLPGLGEVTVRGVSRAEALQAQAADGVGGFERVLLSHGMLEPELTEAEAGQWQAVCEAGELRPVTDMIVGLSGMGEGAAKAAYKSDGREPGPGERVLPGPGAGDDGEPAPDGDAAG